MDKWVNETDMGYVITTRYNVILVSLSLQQSMMFFLLRSQWPRDCFAHHVICIGHVHDNHFVQVNSWSSCLCIFVIKCVVIIWMCMCLCNRYFYETLVPYCQQLCYGQHIVISMQSGGLHLTLVEWSSIPIWWCWQNTLLI